MAKLIDLKLFVSLTLAFIFAAIAGTLLHEAGHYLAARALGYGANIHFAFTTIQFDRLANLQDDLVITGAGPIQSIATGTSGFFLIVYFRNRFKHVQKLKCGQWLLIFIALFWLRAPADFFIWNISPLFPDLCGGISDEMRIASYFHISPIWIYLVCTLPAIAVFFYSLWLIPTGQKFTFIASGLIGGSLGYSLWLFMIGKYILP